MERKNLEKLVEYVQKQYTEAESDYEMSSTFSMGSPVGRIALCKKFISKINELYGTLYELK